MKYAKLALMISGICVLLCVCQLLMTLNRIAQELPLIVQSTIHTEMQLTRATVRDAFTKTESDLNRQLTSLRHDTFSSVDLIRVDANTQLNQALQIVNDQLSVTNQSVAKIAGIRDDIKPTIDQVNDLSPSIMRNTLGLIAAGKVTLGESAQTMKQVRLATPELLSSIQRVADNSDKSTQATTKTMNNIAELTKPLPRWVRIPLSIFPSVATIATPFVLR